MPTPTPDTAEALLSSVRALAAELSELGAEFDRCARLAVRLARTETVADAWVRAHGELVSKREAARIMGCSEDTIYRLIRAGDIRTAPNGAVNVRSCAEYANRKECRH